MSSNDVRKLQSTTIQENLSNLDGDLLAHFGLNRHFEITIVGSSALILLGVTDLSRWTTDIDVLETPDEIRSFFAPYQMNTMVETFLYTYPETWRKRKQKLEFDGDCLSIYTMSLEDLALLKLLAFRKRDQDDLENIVRSNELDWKLFDLLVKDPTELRINLATEDDWNEFLTRYEWLLKKRHI